MITRYILCFAVCFAVMLGPCGCSKRTLSGVYSFKADHSDGARVEDSYDFRTEGAVFERSLSTGLLRYSHEGKGTYTLRGEIVSVQMTYPSTDYPNSVIAFKIEGDDLLLVAFDGKQEAKPRRFKRQ